MPDGTLSDEALALKAQNGDTAAVEELMRRYKNGVRSHARKFFLIGGETEDLVQEGMIGLYYAVLGFREAAGKSFKNFAYLCVTRRIYDALRSAARNVPCTDGSDPDTLPRGQKTPEVFLLLLDEQREFYTKLSRVLSDFEYRVVTLYLEGVSYADIAEATGKDVKSIDNALVRAKRKLQSGYAGR